MIGRKIIFKEILDSTNNYVAKLVLEGRMEHGTVIMAGQQTAGKGQRGAVWEAEPDKNLIFSTWLQHENLAVNRQQALTQCVSLALSDVLSSYGLEPKIKWPNDLVIGSSKIAGILIENYIGESGVKNSIVGIGLNVNQLNFGEYNATSMALLLQRELVISEIALTLTGALNRYYAQIQAGQFAGLHGAYQQKLWLRGEKAAFEELNASFSGRQGLFEGEILGTDEEGRLQVLTPDGIRLFQHKEIRFLARDF